MWEKGKRVFEVKAVLIELCRIEIEYAEIVTRLGRIVLIELCRIEI